MLRWIVVVAVTAAGCAADAYPSGPPEQSIEETAEWPLPPHRDLDLLLVTDGALVGDDRLEAVLRDLPLVLDAVEGGWPDIHIAVVSSATGELEVCAPVGPEPHLVDIEWDWRTGARHRNYPAGRLGDALVCATDQILPALEHRPLEAIRRAVAHPLFRREQATLAVAILAASDDRSPDPVGDAVRALVAATGGGRLLLAAVTPPDAPRLRALLDAFPQRATWVSLDEPNWIRIYEELARSWRLSLALPCLQGPIADADPAAPGLQPDCSVSRVSWSGPEARAETCDDQPRGGLCYEWREEPDCQTPSSMTMTIELRDERPRDTFLRIRCLVE